MWVREKQVTPWGTIFQRFYLSMKSWVTLKFVCRLSYTHTHTHTHTHTLEGKLSSPPLLLTDIYVHRPSKYLTKNTTKWTMGSDGK